MPRPVGTATLQARLAPDKGVLLRPVAEVEKRPQGVTDQPAHG